MAKPLTLTELSDAKRQCGVYRERKAALSAVQWAELRHRIATGEQKTAVARAFGISQETRSHHLQTAA